MKSKTPFLILLGAILFATTYLSCTKSSSTHNLANSLIGKWKISYDSSCDEGPAVGGINCTVFKGSAADNADAWYNFTSDGKIYIKEGNKLDTATYQISSSDTLTVSNSYPQSPIIFYLSNFINPDSLTLTAIGYNPEPVGILFLNHVSLSRE